MYGLHHGVLAVWLNAPVVLQSITIFSFQSSIPPQWWQFLHRTCQPEKPIRDTVPAKTHNSYGLYENDKYINVRMPEALFTD